MTEFTSILSDDEKYELSALLIDGKYVMPSLRVGKDVWDNDAYLLDKLIPTLEGKIGFQDIKDEIPLSDFGEVMELMNEGIKLGFFENTLTTKNL